MPDPALSAAIREAYATAPVNEVIYHTLELWHPAFTHPVRVVCDREALDARIEATAARNAGEIATFIAFAFDIQPPDQSSEGVPQCTIEIDNVSGEIIEQINLANTRPEPIVAIYREYLSSALDDGPENDPPMELSVISATADAFRIRAVAGFPNLINKRFPNRFYDLETFPGLAQ